VVHVTSSLVRIRGLAKTFGEGETRVEAVRGLELDLERGEIVLVMGPSGSGKTTFLSMLGGLLRVTAGEIWVDDTDIAALTERELPPFRARTFGFIFQDFNLVAALSALENVEVALNIAGRTGPQARERAERLLTGLGLAERLHFPIEKLSGGEKQRVAIARAIANHPALILADEPTANLDSKIGHEIMRLLRRIAKEQGRSVVIVSHDQRIKDIADRVLWLEDGEFKEMVTMATDPVCGMAVEREKAAATLEWAGTTYYFCSKGCRAEFESKQGESIAFAGLAHSS
jgi:putative ABC transport system ATP-binding protein